MKSDRHLRMAVMVQHIGMESENKCNSGLAHDKLLNDLLIVMMAGWVIAGQESTSVQTVIYSGLH